MSNYEVSDARPTAKDYTGGAVDQPPKRGYSRRQIGLAGLASVALAIPAGATLRHALSYEGSGELTPGRIICHGKQEVKVPAGATYSELVEKYVDRDDIDDKDFNRLVGGIALNEKAIEDDESFVIDVGTFVIPREVTEGKPVNLPAKCSLPNPLPER